MVQGEISPSPIAFSGNSSGRTSQSKKMSYQVFRQLDQTATQSDGKRKSRKESTNEENYGAWGPIYQNREHFNNMHMC